MEELPVALVLIAFMALLGVVCITVHSAWPLLVMLILLGL
jgi:hypothetical protein